MAYALLISYEDVVEKTFLKGDIDPEKITPHIEVAQVMSIEPHLGTKLFEKLQADVTAGSVSGNYEVLLEKYVKPALIHATAAEYLTFGAFTASNKGIFKHSSENASTADTNDVQFLAEQARKRSKSYIDRLDSYLCSFGAQYFPEYTQNTNNDLFPQMGTKRSNWNF